MAVPIGMPKLGMTMREGRVVAWSVAAGGRVEKGAPVVVIESEKADVEIEATATGVLRHVYVAEGETVPCGTLLGAITATADEAFDGEGFRREHDRPQPVAESPTPVAPPSGGGQPGPGGRRPVTPAARARARELGVDAEAMPGTGPGGRVTREDVEAWAERRRALVPVAPGVSLEVPTQGSGDPVLLLPGFGVDVSVFARQIPALAQRWRVLGVNPRGVALSDAPAAERYDVGTMAADAAALATEPAHVLGASLGAAVALEMALAHPERVRTLTLITPFVEADARLLAVVDAWCRLAAEVAPESLARVLLPWMFSRRYLGDAHACERTVRGLTAAVGRVPAATLVRTAAGLRAWSRRMDLGRVRVPTLVVVAGEDLLTRGGGDIAAGIPGGRCVEVAGTGHAIALESPEEVNAAVLEHLRK